MTAKSAAKFQYLKKYYFRNSFKMDTDYKKSYGALLIELDNAEKDNIRRIVARRGSTEKRIEERYEPRRIDSRQTVRKVSDSMKFKQRKTSVFNRLSGPIRNNDDENFRPRLASSVIRELPSRQHIVSAQGADSESRARNRRMFGSLQNTLHKFCQEQVRFKQNEEKKAQIEKKVEEQERQERASLRRERELLCSDRKHKQMEMQTLERKDSEVSESAKTKLNSSIRTKTKPHLYFRPKVMTRETEKLLEESQALLVIEEKKRKVVLQALVGIENSLNMYYKAEESKDNIDSCILEENYTQMVLRRMQRLNNAMSSGKKLDTLEVDSEANIIELSDTTAPSVTVLDNLDSSNSMQ